jgi:hypothetical protein
LRPLLGDLSAPGADWRRLQAAGMRWHILRGAFCAGISRTAYLPRRRPVNGYDSLLPGN